MAVGGARTRNLNGALGSLLWPRGQVFLGWNRGNRRAASAVLPHPPGFDGSHQPAIVGGSGGGPGGGTGRVAAAAERSCCWALLSGACSSGAISRTVIMAVASSGVAWVRQAVLLPGIFSTLL